jgi:hypothetical protein
MTYCRSCEAKFPLKKLICHEQSSHRSKRIAAAHGHHFRSGAFQCVLVRRLQVLCRLMIHSSILPHGVLTAQGICSYFVLMGKEVETFGEAAGRGMVLRVECACGRTEYFLASELVKFWRPARKITQHGFVCKQCSPSAVTVTPLDIDLDRLPKGRVMRMRREGAWGYIEWRRERYRG